jgi:hypothetical protein
MFPMSTHTAQPLVADRRNRSEAAAARHRLGRSLARPVDEGEVDGGAVTNPTPAMPWARIAIGGRRRPFRRVRRAVA